MDYIGEQIVQVLTVTLALAIALTAALLALSAWAAKKAGKPAAVHVLERRFGMNRPDHPFAKTDDVLQSCLPARAPPYRPHRSTPIQFTGPADRS